MSKQWRCKEKLQPQILFLQSVLQSACDDVLIQTNLEFLVSLAKPMQEFLISNWSPNGSLFGIIFKWFVNEYNGPFFEKLSVEKAITFKKLSSIDPADKNNHKHPKQVGLGFVVRDTLKKVIFQVSFVFYLLKMIVKFLSATASKLLEKCPLKYPLIQHLVSVIPKKLAELGSSELL